MSAPTLWLDGHPVQIVRYSTISGVRLAKVMRLDDAGLFARRRWAALDRLEVRP